LTNGQAPRNLGLTDTGRPDHQNVFRNDFAPHLARELLAPVTVAHRDRDRAFGFGLTDDVAIQLRNDLPRRQLAHGAHSAASASSS
jgi:hypothetical protein